MVANHLVHCHRRPRPSSAALGGLGSAGQQVGHQGVDVGLGEPLHRQVTVTGHQRWLNTIEEVMERLRIGRSTTFDLISTRRLRSIKVGRRRLVSETALIEFIELLDRDNTD